MTDTTKNDEPTTPTREQQYRTALGVIRSIGAQSGTDLNAMNRIFRVIDEALSQPSPSTPSVEPELTSEQRRERMSPCTLEPIMPSAEPMGTRDATFREAAAIARDVKRREMDLHQCSFDELPAMNRYFVLGAMRAAEHIEAAVTVAPSVESVSTEEAWDRGYRSGFSNAMRRMSDEPNAPTSPNPYRVAPPVALPEGER